MGTISLSLTYAQERWTQTQQFDYVFRSSRAYTTLCYKIRFRLYTGRTIVSMNRQTAMVGVVFRFE